MDVPIEDVVGVVALVAHNPAQRSERRVAQQAERAHRSQSHPYPVHVLCTENKIKKHSCLLEVITITIFITTCGHRHERDPNRKRKLQTLILDFPFFIACPQE